MTRERARERKPSLWDRLDTPTKVVAAIAATIAALAAAIATGAALFGGDNKTVVVQATVGRATPLAGQRIRTCMSRHHLRAARVSLGARNVFNVTFKRCDWPPLVASSADGYTEVWAHTDLLNKPAAAPYNSVATFRAPCEQLDVTFVLDHMETRQFSSRRLDLGRVYQVGGLPSRSVAVHTLDRVPPDVRIPLPTEAGRRAFYVLYGGHFALFDAHCAFGAPPH